MYREHSIVSEGSEIHNVKRVSTPKRELENLSQCGLAYPQDYLDWPVALVIKFVGRLAQVSINYRKITLVN